MRCHPDHGGDADEFKRCLIARDVLCDPDRRKRYDQYGETENANPTAVESLIAALMPTAFEQCKVDPIKYMHDQISKQRSNSKVELVKLEAMKSKQVKRAAKFAKENTAAKNTESRDFILAQINRGIAEFDATIAAINATITVLDQADSFLDGLKYSVERPQHDPAEMYGFRPSPIAGFQSGSW